MKFGDHHVFTTQHSIYICDLLVVKQKFHFPVFIAKILVTSGHQPSERNERGNKPNSFVDSVAGKFMIHVSPTREREWYQWLEHNTV